MSRIYRPFSYYATDEQRDAAALARLRAVISYGPTDDTPAPDDDDREAFDRALVAGKHPAGASS